jgi:hypothetical protein
VLTRVTVRVVDELDPARLLHRRSEFGYTHRSVLALAREPEAVDERAQMSITVEAHRRRAQQQADTWSTARAMILQGTALARSSKLPKQVISDVRAVERVVGRIDSELQRGRP